MKPLRHSATVAAPEALEARIAPARVFGIEADTNKLVSFDSANPGTLLSEVTVTGLHANEFIESIDFNQATGKLFGFGLVDDGATRTGRLYTINPSTGVATSASGVTFLALQDTSNCDLEIDPTNNSSRLVNGLDQNLAIISDGNGSLNDTALDDPNANETISAIAFNHNLGRGSITCYGYNFLTDELVTIGDLNGTPDGVGSGIVKPIAHAKLNGADFVSDNSFIGFDIAAPFGGADVGYLAVSKSGSGVHLYTVDLANAALTDLGAIANGARKFGSVTVDVSGAAPTILGHQATWTDVDGDLVTLSITKGTLTSDNFRMIAGEHGRALAKLTLDPTFAGTNITITAKPGPLGGDGAVNIGRILALGTDLGAVTIPGTLGEIAAGNAGAPAPSIKTLTVRGFDRQLLQASELGASSLADGAGKISIAGNFDSLLDVGSGRTGSIFVGGDLLGGDTFGSGGIGGAGTVGSVTVKGSLRGGTASQSGALTFFGVGNSTTVITIGGSLLGGSSGVSGSIRLNTPAIIKIGGDLHGGSQSFSGSIFSDNANTAFFKSITIGGSIISATGACGVFANRIGTLTVKGSILGADATHPVFLSARGGGLLQTQAGSLAIAKVTIGGSMEFGRIHAGIDKFGTPINVDAAIGSVKIGGDLIASSITAGIDLVDGLVGNNNDKLVGGNSGSTAVIAKIASVTVKGQLYGTIGGPADFFGIEAEQIGSVKIGTTKLALTAGKDNLTTGFTADIHVREF